MLVCDENVIIITGFEPHAPSVPVTITAFASDTARALELLATQAPQLKVMSAMSAADWKALYVQFEAVAQGIIPAIIKEDGFEPNPAGLVTAETRGEG
jgi:hypothetical protein